VFSDHSSLRSHALIFIPLNGHIVVKRTSSEKVTRGGIVLPDSSQKESQIGTVVAVYNEYVDEDGKTRKPRVKPGDTVLFPKYEGEGIELDGEKLLVMKDTCIRGLIHGYEFSAIPAANGKSYEQNMQEAARAAYAEASS